MRYFLIVIGLLVVNSMNAQAFSNSAMVTGGLFGDGFGGEITFNTYLDEVSFTQVALDVSMSNFTAGETTIPYASYALSYSYFTTLYAAGNRDQVLSIGGGLLAGYELVNGGKNDLSNFVFLDGKSKLLYGATAGLELDVIISKRWSAVAKTTQFYHINSNFGKFTNFTGVGFRYYFFK